MVTQSDQLESGLSPETTVAAFEAACNRDADRLFITQSWFAPFRARLLSALPTTLSDTLVEALRDALYKHRPLETVLQFIEQQPITWDEFAQWCTKREHARHLEQARVHLEQARVGFFPWADVEAAENDQELQRSQTSRAHAEAPATLDVAHATETDLRARARKCPGCDRAAAELTWVYFSSPAWTWQQLCGRAGWMVLCKPCHMQVDFFLDRMN